MIQKIFEKCKMLRTQAMDISQILAITRQFYPLTPVNPLTRLFIARKLNLVSIYQENPPNPSQSRKINF